MTELNWSDEPPEERPLYRRLYRPYRDQRLRGVVVSRAVVGAWQHWCEGHVAPCVSPREECAGCRCRYRRQWRGYLEVLRTDPSELAVFELTPETARCFPRRFRGELDGVRGFAITVYRRGGQQRGAVLCDLADLPARVAQLPEPIDLRALVQAILAAPPKDQAQHLTYYDGGDDEVIPLPGAG